MRSLVSTCRTVKNTESRTPSWKKPDSEVVDEARFDQPRAVHDERHQQRREEDAERPAERHRTPAPVAVDEERDADARRSR